MLIRNKTGIRIRQVLNILTKHGFSYLAEQIANGRASMWGRLVHSWYFRSHRAMGFPQRVRRVFEELGPTFTKLGQILSTRPDLIPPEFARELSTLQDHVDEMSAEEIRAQVVKELGDLPEAIFDYFDYRPVASASIGQVHLGILKTGQKVAVKVQRPRIRETIQQDIDLIKRFSKVLNERTILGQVCDVAEIVNVFERHMQRELDYTTEALNTENFRNILSDVSIVVVPAVYWRYTTKEVLTVDYIEGTKFKDLPPEFNFDPQQLANRMMYAVLHPFFAEGVFHGDPHPGNVLVMADGRVALIDFGIVGRFEPEYRQMAALLMLALAEKDVRRVMDITLKVSKIIRPFEEQHFYEDTAELVDKVGAVGQGEISFGQIIQGMVSISLKHGVKMNSVFLLLGKAIVMSEALAQSVYPGFNILTVAHPLSMQRFQKDMLPTFSFDDIYQQISVWRKIFTNLPEDILNIVRKTAAGEMKLIFHHRNLQWMYDMMEVTSSRLAISIILAALIVGSALVLFGDVGPKIYGFSLLGLIGFVFASLLGGWMSVHLLRYLR
ncbi:MAG: ABC1 kinase family protein [Thermincolia bacterium]